MIPMLHSLYDFSSSNTVLNLYAHPLVCDHFNDATTAYPDYLAYEVGMFRYWRGGIKYQIHFVTNSFTTARFRIVYIVDYLEVDLQGGGDFPSVVVDVKGYTKFEFTVPYLWQAAYRPTIPPGTVPGTNAFLTEPKIAVEMITLPTTSQGTEPHITAVVFRAAAEDFQVAAPCSQRFDPVISKPPAIPSKKKGQSSISDDFRQTFAPITCDCMLATERGYTTTETVGKIKDMQMRFAEEASTESVLQPQLVVNGLFEVGPGAPLANIKLLQPFYMHQFLFKYQRGSMRFRYIHTWNATPDLGNVYFTPGNETEIDQGAGMTVWPRSMNPHYVVEIPWIGTVPYMPMTNGYSNEAPSTMMVNNFGRTTTTTDTVLIAFGDDRTHMYLLPPPHFRYVDTLKTTSTATTTTMTTVTVSNSSKGPPGWFSGIRPKA